jgi:hypothetical protein
MSQTLGILKNLAVKFGDHFFKIKATSDLTKNLYPFSQCFFRNYELNNNLPTVNSQLIRILNATESEITCSWLPNIPEIFNPAVHDNLAHWALMFVDFPEKLPDASPYNFDYTDIVRIESGDREKKTLCYSSKNIYDYKKWNNRTAVLFNPFCDWEIKSNPIVQFDPTISWHTQYIAPAGLFKRQDQQFIFLINGESRHRNELPKQKVGAFVTPDPWNGVFSPVNNGDFIFQGPTGAESFQITSLIQSDRPGDWLGFGNVRRGMKWSVCGVQFHEDFTNIQYFEDLIIPPKNPINKLGEYFPDIIYFKGKYRLMWCNLVATSVGDRYISEAISDNILGPFDSTTTGGPVFSKANKNDGIFRSSHTSQTTYFIWQEKLFCLYDGTSCWKASGNRGNRLFGIAVFDELQQQWMENPWNPIFINPIYGDKVWGPEWKWCSDHLGGKPILFQTDPGDLLFFFSACDGTDTYRPGCARAKQKLVA